MVAYTSPWLGSYRFVELWAARIKSGLHVLGKTLNPKPLKVPEILKPDRHLARIIPLVSWEWRNGKENGNYYNGLCRD